MNNSFNSLIKLILPEGMEEYFELTSHTNEGATLHLYLKELNILPTEHSGNKLISKGFFDAVTIQDFPIRGQSVFLHITRRRWLNEDTGDNKTTISLKLFDSLNYSFNNPDNCCHYI